MRKILLMLCFLPSLAFATELKGLFNEFEKITESQSFKSKKKEVQNMATCFAVNHLKKHKGVKLSFQNSFLYSMKFYYLADSEDHELMLLQNIFSHTLSSSHATLWSMQTLGHSKLLDTTISSVDEGCDKYPAI